MYKRTNKQSSVDWASWSVSQQPMERMAAAVVVVALVVVVCPLEIRNGEDSNN